MNVFAGIFIGVAAAAAFFFVEPFLLGLDQPWRVIGAVAVLIFASGLAHRLGRKVPSVSDQKRSVLSENEAGRDIETEIDRLDTTQGTGNVLSRNKAEGGIKVKVTDSKL